MLDLDRQIAQLKRSEALSEPEVKALCGKAREILAEEGNVLTLRRPITICGDMHGQFYDMLKLFEAGDTCPQTNYLFIGDFVDRGHHSVENFLLLLALKVRYPDWIALLRGNHGSRGLAQVYGFYDECMHKYGSSNVWRYCTDIFDYLSLSAIIENKNFCVHGGHSRYITRLDKIMGAGHGTLLLASCYGPASGSGRGVLVAADTKAERRNGSFEYSCRKIYKVQHHVIAAAGNSQILEEARKAYNKKCKGLDLEDGAALLMDIFRRLITKYWILLDDELAPYKTTFILAGVTPQGAKIKEIFCDWDTKICMVQDTDLVSRGSGSEHIQDLLTQKLRTKEQVLNLFKDCFYRAVERDKFVGGRLDVLQIADGKVYKVNRGYVKAEKVG